MPVLGGASAFSTSCLPFLSPIVSPHVCLCWVGSCLVCLCWTACPPSRGLASPCLPLSPHHVRLCWMVCPPFQGLVSPFVSHLLSCFPYWDGVPAFSRSCLPSSPIVPFSPLSPHRCACVGGCVRLPEVLSPLVSRCLPSCLSLSPVVSNCFALSAIVSTCPTLSPNMCACVGWSTFPKSCFSSSPIVSLDMRACVGWCVRLPEVLSPLVSPHVCLCWLVPQPWMVCPPSRGIVSPCLPVLDGLSASPRSCLHLSSIVSHCPANCLPLSPFLSPRLPLSPVAFHCFPVSPHMCACAGWCVRLPRSCLPIVSHCLPNWCLCWMVFPAWIISAFKRPCLPMSPIVSPHVCLCWMLCPPSRGLVSFCLPLFPHMCACNVLCWMVLQLSRDFVSPLVSHCLPSCFPVLDGVSAFPRFCLPCLPACLSAGLPSCLQACLPTCLSSCFPLWWVV